MGFIIIRDVELEGLNVESFGKATHSYSNGQFFEDNNIELRIKSPRVEGVSPRVDVFNSAEELIALLTAEEKDAELEEERHCQDVEE